MRSALSRFAKPAAVAGAAAVLALGGAGIANAGTSCLLVHGPQNQMTWYCSTSNGPVYQCRVGQPC